MTSLVELPTANKSNTASKFNTASNFKQTSSILKKLRWVTFPVAFAFVVELVGVIFSGNHIIDKLSDIHLSNQLFDYTSTFNADIEASGDTLSKVLLPGSQIDDLIKSYDLTHGHAKNNLDQALLIVNAEGSKPFDLTAIQSAFYDYSSSAKDAFDAYQNDHRIDKAVRNKLLVTFNYKSKLSELIRKFQIKIKENETRNFHELYQFRYIPLTCTLLVTLLSVSFVVLSAVRIISQFKKSMFNLINATQNVARGNLSYQAEIITHDELGFLTSAFNEMVTRLNKGQNRLARLQSISTALSGAPEPEQVGTLVMSEGMNVVGASMGALMQVNASGLELETVSTFGLVDKLISLDKELPITEAMLLRKPIYIESIEEHQKHWPTHHISNLEKAKSYAILPLMFGGRALGAIAICFSEEKKLSDEDREFCISLAQQCAQALNRAQLYKDAQRAVHIRDEFLSVASHELRTPITPLKLQIQSLLRIIEQGKFATLTEERLLKIAKTSDTQIVRLTRLVEELLDVTRITAGKIELRKERVDISKVIVDVVERFKLELVNINCEPKFFLQPNLFVQVDVSRIEQVIVNLLTNAMRYGAGKPIEFYSDQTNGKFIEIRVKDYGMGIAAKDQTRIFERFERAVPTSNFGGLGLGLFIVKQIIKQHNGMIQVRSVLGEGSTFILNLPA